MTKLMRSLVSYMRSVIFAIVLGKPVPEPETTDEHRAITNLRQQVRWALARGYMIDLDLD